MLSGVKRPRAEVPSTLPVELSNRLATIAPILVGAFFIGAGQNLFAPNMTSISKSFGLADNERDLYLGGYLAVAFFLVGAPMSVAAGILVDRVHRVQLLSNLLAIGAVAVSLMALSPSLWLIIGLRAIQGAIAGGLSPLLFSIVADLYLPAERPSFSSYAGLTISAGTIVGQLAAGLLGGPLGWRTPFFVVGAGCAVAAVIVRYSAVEPARGLADSVASKVDLTQQQQQVPSQPSSQLDRQTGNGGGTSGSVVDGNTGLRDRTAATGDRTIDTDGNGPNSNSPPLTSPLGGGLVGHSTSPALVTAKASLSGFGSTSNGAAGAGALGQSTSSLSLQQLFLLLKISLQQSLPQVQHVLSIRTNRLLYGQSIFGTVPWSVITVFLTDYLTQNKGYSTAQATLLVVLFGIGGATGGIAGGAAGKHLYGQGPQWVPMVFGPIQALSSLPMLYILGSSPMHAVADGDASFDKSSGGGGGSSQVPLYLITILGGMLASATGPNLKAMLMNTNAPDTRGMVFTCGYVADSLSKGLAPYIIGLLVSMFGSHQRTLVFTMAMMTWPLSGLLVLLSSSTVGQDEADMKQRITAGASKAGQKGGQRGKE